MIAPHPEHLPVFPACSERNVSCLLQFGQTTSILLAGSPEPFFELSEEGAAPRLALIFALHTGHATVLPSCSGLAEKTDPHLGQFNRKASMVASHLPLAPVRHDPCVVCVSDSAHEPTTLESVLHNLHQMSSLFLSI